jgi:hypothetical protein
MTATKPLHTRKFDAQCPGCMTPVSGRIVQLQGGAYAYVAHCRCGWSCDMEWRANEIRDLMVDRQLYERA